MITVTIPYQTGDFIFRLADWLVKNGCGSHNSHDWRGRLVGPGWKLYHTTVNYHLVTKAEFDNEDIAAMFALRWT